MSTPEERLAYQIGIKLDEVVAQNEESHKQIRAWVSGSLASISAEVAKHSKRWSVYASLVGLVGVALPTYSQIREASATAKVIEVAKEATRQQFLELQRTREAEQQAVADRAAKQAIREYVETIVIRQDTIRR